MFKKQPSDNQLIFITFILVVLLAIPTFQTLTQKDPVSEMTADLATEIATNSRTPASIPEKSAPKVSKATSRFATYDLNCATKPFEFDKVVGTYVQFQGKNCLRNFKDGDVEILNKTNGFTASIFNKGSDNYQTDLIQLQDGENEITIRYRQSSGKATEEIIRITASSI